MTERQLMNMQQLRTVEKRAYALRIKNFRQFLDDVLPNNDSSGEDWDKFYDSDWSISFGGKTVTIHNGAVVYNSMCDALDEYIDECL